MKKILIVLVLLALNAFSAKNESEHPPLSDDTKKAIAKFQQNPTPQNKEAILKALTKAYDNVIAQKQNKLAQRIKNKDQAILKYLNQIKKGQIPAFLNHNDSTKNAQRADVASAIKAYQNNPKANQTALKSALEAYYDAFLDEQRAHINETIALKQTRLSESLERFSKGFKGAKFKKHSDIKNVKDDEILFDITRAFVSSGAEFAPIDPQNRVNEREYNAKINAAIKKYETSKNSDDKKAIKDEIYNALKNALKVRTDGLERAEQKGLKPAIKLLEKLKDANFISEQKNDLSAQRNLYGRIDRVITFGDLNYSAKNAEISKKIFAKIKANDASAQDEFNKLYTQSLTYQKQHLNAISKNLENIALMLTDSVIR